MKNEIDLSFCIWNYEDITHEDITKLTGLIPYIVYTKGQKKNPKFSALAKENAWIFRPTLDKEASFEQQMNSLLDILESKIDIFKPLCEKYYCEFSCALYVYIDTEESTPWVHLDKRYNNLIKELKIEFDVDIILLAGT